MVRGGPYFLRMISWRSRRFWDRFRPKNHGKKSKGKTIFSEFSPPGLCHFSENSLYKRLVPKWVSLKGVSLKSRPRSAPLSVCQFSSRASRRSSTRHFGKNGIVVIRKRFARNSQRSGALRGMGGYFGNQTSTFLG